MAKDPAFLFYDGDAARDVSHMNRLERGCYFDLIQAQRKFGRLTISTIQKLLNRDFETCWSSLEIILSKDDDSNYYIEWVELSIINRVKHSEKQKENIEKRWGKNNPETRNEREQNAKQKGSHTRQEWDDMRLFFNNSCVCCDGNEGYKALSKDHIIALCIGGDDSINNIQPLCPICNARKGNKIIDYREPWAVKNSIVLPNKYQIDTNIIPNRYDSVPLVNEIEIANEKENKEVIVAEEIFIKTEADLLNEFCEKHFSTKYINEKSRDMFDKLIRIDKFTSLEIQRAITLARSVPFWNSNFLSPLKLRDKDQYGVKYIDRFLQIAPTQQKTPQSDAGNYVKEKLERLSRTGSL